MALKEHLCRREEQVGHLAVRIGGKLVMADTKGADETFLDLVATQHRQVEHLGEFPGKCRLSRPGSSGDDYASWPRVHCSCRVFEVSCAGRQPAWTVTTDWALLVSV